jgi:bifunctional DNA-binding transcriptional regulator/antitoxin component of YhaV-PrlF toxin-antitoxin module
MPKGFHPRAQGDVGEAAAIDWLTRIGAAVLFPLFHSPDYDLIADLGARLLRVQVKTSSCKHGPTDHFAVQLATSGGNQSWDGVVKEFDAGRFDFLFVLVQDGRRWFIPAAEIEGRHGISLGGIKYSEFEVGRGEPLDQDAASRLDPLRGGAGVGEPGQTVNLVAMPEWVRFPPPPPPPPPGGDSRSGDDHHAVGRTKMSSHHQVAVPRAVAAACGIKPGDRFRVESDGTGRFVMTRVEEYVAQQAAQLTLSDEEPAGAERRSPD